MLRSVHPHGWLKLSGYAVLACWVVSPKVSAYTAGTRVFSLLLTADEAVMACHRNFMRALKVVDALRHVPCQEGPLALIMVAYDMVVAEPQLPVSVLAERVATVGAQMGLIFS